MENETPERNILGLVRDTSKRIATAVSNTTVAVADNTRNAIASTAEKFSTAIDKKKVAAKLQRQEKFHIAFEPIAGTAAGDFVLELGESPVKLTEFRAKQIKDIFPIPREQNILWADAEFDLRPSGIAATDRGVFIRTNVGMMDGKIGISNAEIDDMTMDEAEAYKQHQAQFHGGKPVLLYYSWDDFNTAWFISESELENKALLVEPQCSQRFVDVCRSISADLTTMATAVEVDVAESFDAKPVAASIAAGAAVESAQIAVFAEHKAAINTPAGHGEMAEEAITLLDKLHGLDAKVIGRDNAKDGADRSIGDIFIQTKYYKTARGSLEACFRPESGEYRYMRDGQPMQLEVPKDQYQKVLEGFRKKIEQGKVPGVTDPNEAKNIVKEGRLTYQQAVNLTKPGTIDSLKYDAATGIVTCSCAMGITFVTTVYLAWRKTGDITQAIQAGASAGLQVFGISFVQHMLVSQIARTGLANTLMAPSQYVVGRLGYQASATIVNGIRALSGKGAIYGAAASKHLAKILRSNVVTSVLSFAVFSIPDTYNVALRKISGAQYAKNMSVLAGSIATGAGGAVAAGVVAAKVAGAAGTAVAPGVGTAVGIAGGFIGGTVGAGVIKAAGDLLHEDDIEVLGRMFNAYVSCMIGEYFLDETEIDALIAKIGETDQKAFKKLFESIAQSEQQEETIRKFLSPVFDAVVAERPAFLLPTADTMIDAMNILIEDAKTNSQSLENEIE